MSDDKIKDKDIKEEKAKTAPDLEEEKEPQEEKESAQTSFKEAIADQAREDEKPQSYSFSLRKIIGGEWLTTAFLRQQIGVILLIAVFTIIYISNRYSCQKKMLKIDRLNTELTDAKYRALSSASQLTEKCRESNVLEMLQNNKDSVLKTPNQPPYIIYIPEQHQTTTINENE